MVGVKWNLAAKSTFLVNIQVEALDRASLLADVTRTLSDQHVVSTQLMHSHLEK